MSNLSNNDYEKALDFAKQKHKGQYRKGGQEYIVHPLSVSQIVKNQGYGIDYQIVALFHDLLEDTDATISEIEQLSNKEVANAVQILTKYDGYNMAEYVAKIKNNDMAFVVKAADRLHNLQSAVDANESFRRKYILETIDWYWDFSLDIRKATKFLAKTLSKPMIEYPFLYEDNDI